jgi:hypothetical protein
MLLGLANWKQFGTKRWYNSKQPNLVWVVNRERMCATGIRLYSSTSGGKIFVQFSNAKRLAKT